MRLHSGDGGRKGCTGIGGSRRCRTFTETNERTRQPIREVGGSNAVQCCLERFCRRPFRLCKYRVEIQVDQFQLTHHVGRSCRGTLAIATECTIFQVRRARKDRDLRRSYVSGRIDVGDLDGRRTIRHLEDGLAHVRDRVDHNEVHTERLLRLRSCRGIRLNIAVRDLRHLLVVASRHR